MRGRCLPYGRGITFWPLVEIARELTGAVETDTPAEAYRKLLNAADGDTTVAERVASVTGLGERQFPVEEVFWATRKLLETRGAARPVLVCIEDVHWAEQTLLELIAHVHDAAHDAAITLVCAARPTLTEIRPDWRSRGHTLELEPLSLLESEAIVRIQLGDADLPESS